VRGEASFRACVDAVRPGTASRMQAVVGVAARVLARHAELAAQLTAQPDGPSRADLTAQLADLVYDGFVAATPEPHFSRLERYLHAGQVRLRAWATHPSREAQHLATITELEDAYAAAIADVEVGELPRAASEVGWLLEELRVSLFAQSLGTAQPVSAKRVRSAITGLAAR